MTSEQIQALKAAAQLIAHGYQQEWGIERNGDSVYVGTYDPDGVLCPFIDVSISEWSGEDGDDTRLADFIAKANPAFILSLLAGREADKALIAELKEALEKSQEQSSKWLEAYHKAVSIGARYEERIAELEARTLTAAATDVLAERQRQVTAEGWTPAHDDEHVEGQLSDAAACYALFATDQSRPVPDYWPWPDNWWKQHGERRDLVRAGALIIAEIERLDRAAGITLVVGGEDATN